MAVRQYEVRGYRNTGYSPGSPEQAEFDRPFSREVFETLYPDGDHDVLDLQEPRSLFLLRETYYKESIKIKWDGTQKDIIYQIDYLRIKATNGDNPETVYYFVDSSRTRWLGATTAILYLELDEQTTANASQTVEMQGIIEKRQYNVLENKLNFLPESFSTIDPLETTIAYITAETGKGYTVSAGVPKTSGVRHFAEVHCDLGRLLESPPVVADLPAAANSLTVRIAGAGGEDIVVRVDGMVLVDTDNATVKNALNKLREMGNEALIGSTFSFPSQTLRAEPTVYASNGVNLITEISGGDFHFTVDNLPLVPDYGNIYSSLRNPKAGYQFITYTIVSPATGETKSYTLQEVIEGATVDAPLDLPTGKMKFIGSGIPMAQGAMYWRPAGLTQITPVAGYDSRVIYIESVRGSEWNDYGLALTGQANAELLALQLSQARQSKSINDAQTESQYALSKANIDLNRAQSALGLASDSADVIGNLFTGNFTKAMTGAFKAVVKRTGEFGVGLTGEGDINALGNVYDRQEAQALKQRDLANKMNELGLNSVINAANYSKRSQSLSISPPTGLDMNRIMGSSLLVILETPSIADVIRYDEELYWSGMTVYEPYSGKLKDHAYLLPTGEDFAYVKLGMCTIALPDEPSGWANSLAWRRKIQAELQTGGRYWKKKRYNYKWDVPIPVDGGYAPGGSGDRVYYENLIAEGAPTTTHLKVRLNEDMPLETLTFTVDGATAGVITKTGFGEYLIPLEKGSFIDKAAVSVSLEAVGKSFTPKRRAVSVSKEFGGGEVLGRALTWVSAETPPWTLGYTIEATCEIDASEHYILWTSPVDNENLIITRTYKFEHSFVNALEYPYSKDRVSIATVAGMVSIIIGGELDKLTVLDALSGGTRIIPVVGDVPMLGKTSFKNFVVERDGILYPSGSAYAYYTGTMRLYPLQAQSKELISKFGIPLYTRYPLWTIRSVTYSGGPTTTMEDLSIRTHLSESESMNGNPFHSGTYNPTKFLALVTAGGLALGTWKGVQGLYRMNFGSELLPVELIEEGISVYGASFSNGIYIQKGGNLVYRYDSGEEVIIESPLPAMQVKEYKHPFYTDGMEVYRIKG